MLIWLILAAVVLPSTVALITDGVPTLRLHRAFPLNERVNVSQLRARDMARHGRMTLQVPGTAIDVPVYGSFNPYNLGLYYTTILLGTPPQEFNVQIDTGTSVLWVSCTNCSGCPSKLQDNYLNFFNASNSSTAQAISCSDRKCKLGTESSGSICESKSHKCSFKLQYWDGTAGGTSGHYLSDVMLLNVASTNASQDTNRTAPVVFGCSTVRTGDLTSAYRATDGYFGFGPQPISIVSQLSSQGITPSAFSHCLSGDSQGGGLLSFGEFVAPGMVYTSFVPNQPQYKLFMKSISVNGHLLPINSSAFATSGNTVVDSETTLPYLAEPAYTPFIHAINKAVADLVLIMDTKEGLCYLIKNASAPPSFPKVSLNFKSGASMVLEPQDYLLEEKITQEGQKALDWCMGFQKGESTTILGELVLKDKAIVYDLARQRVGWAKYNCSRPIKVNGTVPNSNAMTRIKPCRYMQLVTLSLVSLLLCIRWRM